MIDWFRPFHQRKKWRKLARLHKKEMREKGKYYCAKCGSTEALESDHILPVSRYPGLKYAKHNLQLLCKTHNRKKGATIQITPATGKVAAIIVIKRLIPSLLFALTVYYCITVPTPQAIEFIDTVILFFQ